MIIYNNKILNTLSIFMNIRGITLYPFIILREEQKGNIVLLNHERIHIAQQKELLIIGFYIQYVLEWLVRLFMKGNAYRNISFEKEAYKNQSNLDYLKTRKLFNL